MLSRLRVFVSSKNVILDRNCGTVPEEAKTEPVDWILKHSHFLLGHEKNSEIGAHMIFIIHDSAMGVTRHFGIPGRNGL